MKLKIGLFGLLVVAFLAFALGQTGKSKVSSLNAKESPLGLPEAVIPELMGSSQPKTGAGVTNAQVQQIEESKKFKSYLESSYIRLPTIASLRLSKDGDFHYVPAEVIQSSEIFGEIAEKLSRNPWLTQEALNFFSVCAGNEQLMTSVRAVCARNLKDWAHRAQIDISKVQIPENISRIADVLPHQS
jgi:hypothetical protein